MEKVIVVLVLILMPVLIPILLGFLLSNTITMQGDMEQLKAENQNLSQELSQMRSEYQAMVQERDAVLAEYESLKYQFVSIQAAYLAENQARLKAEADVAAYQNMLIPVMGNVQTSLPSACLPAGEEAAQPEELLLSTIVPAGASSLLTLAAAGLVTAMIQHARRQKKLRRLPAQIRNLR